MSVCIAAAERAVVLGRAQGSSVHGGERLNQQLHIIGEATQQKIRSTTNVTQKRFSLSFGASFCINELQCSK